MPDREHVLQVVGGWVQKAENDLDNAVHTVGRGEGCPTDTVGFHAQQCAEKYLKALLVANGIEFPRTHDIDALIALAPQAVHAILSVEEQRELTSYATITRYPGDYEPIPLDEARQAVRLSRRVRTAVRKLLPKDALRRRKR